MASDAEHLTEMRSALERAATHEGYLRAQLTEMGDLCKETDAAQAAMTAALRFAQASFTAVPW